MLNKTSKQIRNTLAIGGLAAMVSGCMVALPTQNGGVRRLFISEGVIGSAFDGMTQNLRKNPSIGQQSYSQQGYFGGPVEAREPLGHTPYSYPFLQYSGSGSVTIPDNFKHKRAVISLSESDIVYFGTSWNAGKMWPWSKPDTSYSFFAFDDKGSVIYSEPEKMDDSVGKKVRSVKLNREILRKAGSHITVGFYLRREWMRKENKWGWPSEDDVYTVPIVP